MRKNIREFNGSKISKLYNHVEDNVIKEDADKQFQSFNLKLKKLMANNDLSIMDENLANKDIEDIIVSSNFPEDHLGVPLHIMIKVLEVIDDDESSLK